MIEHTCYTDTEPEKQPSAQQIPAPLGGLPARQAREASVNTRGRLTILLGQRQAATGQRLSLRRLAELAGVPKDLVYRLDAGHARYVDLDALARLCRVLKCNLDDILAWGGNGDDND